MADVFRIIDRFVITGRGTVYTMKLSKGALLRVGDLLFDLHGNKFTVKGIEMFTRPRPNMDDLPIGIMFELVDGVEAKGNIMVRDLADVNFLFCSHPLYPRRVDEDYEEEYQAAGLDHSCALFSYEDFEDGKLKLYGEDISGLTIYRGWMIKPEKYRKLYDVLEQKGIFLINTPEEYERYHLLPGWYEAFKDETATSVWTNSNNLEDVMHISKMLEGAYIVKDYVKSRKHEWYDACFIKNIKDKNNLATVVNNFITRQGEDLVGGVVLRQFENLKQIGYHEQSGMPLSEEYRVFVYAGRILAIDDYWTKDTDVSLTEEEYRWIESITTKVRSNFVTIDIARKEDGTLIIMELGDGQVSGLQQLKAASFYKAFKGVDIHNSYTAEEIKQIITTYTRLDIEPELTLKFRDKASEYLIIGYTGHVSFQRCGYADGSGEIDYPDIETLFGEKLIDDICLNRDWYKVTDIWCEPDIDDRDYVIEQYRLAAENRKMQLGDRYHIYKAVKKEIDKWNPYCLLPDAPRDEFDGESEDVARLIRFDSTVEMIAKAVSKVFSDAFEPQCFTIEKCMDVAEQIRIALDEEV